MLGEVDVSGSMLFGDVEDENTALGVIPPALGDVTNADPGVIAGEATLALVYDGDMGGGCIVVKECPEYMFCGNAYS